MVSRYSRAAFAFLTGFVFGSIFLLTFQFHRTDPNLQFDKANAVNCLEKNSVNRAIYIETQAQQPALDKISIDNQTQQNVSQKDLIESKHNAAPKVQFIKQSVDDPYDSLEKLETRNNDYWELAPHYNVDDYGVPVDEYILSVENMNSMTPIERANEFKKRGIKTVLYYHSAYGSTTYGFNFKEASKQGQLPYIMKGCKRRDCFCTDVKDFIPIEEFDAILFYSRSISKSSIPTVRKPHQRYILWEVESATYLIGFNPKLWPNFFNWTHTYRRDSDFWEPWGILTQHTEFPKPAEELIEDRKTDLTFSQTKTKGIAWFVSNCGARSGRDQFAKELSKYVQVDIYGRCGPLKCERSEGGKCWEMVEKDYFFYFSAENSRCKDYITEKFYGALRYNVIPIVFGGAVGEKDYYLAPMKSHINVDDFENAKDLGMFLKKLMSDKEEYSSYFWWKPYYSTWLGRWKKAHCEICDRLHNKNEPIKIYKDIHDWWVTQGKCR